MARFAKSGFALVTVLLVLAALVALATPFLLSMRNETRIVSNRVDFERARMSALGAREHARRVLQETHPSKDPTPLYDSEEELHVDTVFPKEFFNARDPRGEIWSLRVEDEQSKLNINSATPFALARLLGFTVLSRDVATTDIEIPVHSTDSFPPEGFLWLHGELIQYRAKSPSAFEGCTRGVFAETKRFLEPQNHKQNAVVLDDRVYALARYRIYGNRRYRPFETIRSLPMAGMASAGGALESGQIESQLPLLTRDSQRGGVGDWGAASRVQSLLEAGETRDLLVQNGHYFAEGTTVRIWGDDGKQEFGMVLESQPGNGKLTLDVPVLHGYQPYEAQIQPLLPHPVNLNSARPDLIAMLLQGIRLRFTTVDDTVTPEIAAELTRRILENRPITGFEDFVKRVLKPAIDDQKITPVLARTIFINALQSSDGQLGFSSTPFTFASENVFSIDSTVSINSPSGSERARSSVREIMGLAPQEPLLFGLLRQDLFEEQFRLGREARFWLTGPEHVGMYDGSNQPPSRHIANLQRMVEGQTIFPSSDVAVSYLSLAPYRKEPSASAGRYEHFDFERNPEGRLLANGVWTSHPESAPASLVLNAGQDPPDRLYPGAVEAWFRPKNWNGTFLELFGGFTDRNRVALFVESNHLVYRVYDLAGDDPKTANVEAGEIKLPLSELAADTWTHLSVAWQGNKPSDITLLVDGVKRGNTQALTRLAAPLSIFNPSPSTIPDANISVESTEGFPPSGVLRIGGSELVEYTSISGNSFRAKWVTSGGNPKEAWVGGRASRLGMLPPATGQAYDPKIVPPEAFQTGHQKGDGVELYGYSAVLRSNIPPGGAARLPAGLGKFTFAHLVTGIAPNTGDSITLQTAFGAVPIGTGILANTTRPWVLASVDNDPDFMKAFSQNGGYALVFQGNETNRQTGDGTPLFGAELVHYSGWSGTTLHVDQRAVTSQKLQSGSIPGFDARAHAFLTDFSFDADFKNRSCAWVFVLPISVGTNGISSAQYQANPSDPLLSDIVQVYDANDESKTEWIRYDEVIGNQLVRTDPAAIQQARNDIGLQNFLNFSTDFDLDCPTGTSQNTAAQPVPNNIGVQEINVNSGSIVFRVWASMKHRGVLGTYSHSHPNGAELIPVFQVPWQRSSNPAMTARPGRNDRVAVIEASTNNLISWKTINWAYYPDNSDNVQVPQNIANPRSTNQIDLNRIYLAFKEQPGLPTLQNYPQNGNFGSSDIREFARIVKFPSGELGAQMTQITMGGGAAGSVEGEMDELEFFNQIAPGGSMNVLNMGRFQLALDADENARTLTLSPLRLNYSHGEVGYATTILNSLPRDAGLIKIDDEILGYIEYDPVSGQVTLAPNGRGLLNSEPAAHGRGSSVIFLNHIRASELKNSLSFASSDMQVDDPGKFPFEGTVLIDRELIHYTRKVGPILGMPWIQNEEPTDKGEEKQKGIFRGRFGTVPNSHSAGDMVISFPFRYWDRYQERADVAELSYFATHLHAPGGYFQSLFWEEEPAIRDPFVDCVALARIDDWSEWSADPKSSPGLFHFDTPSKQDALNRFDRSGNHLSIRFFARYRPGAFDPVNFVSHSWKKAPRIRKVVVEYLAPNQVLSRSEQRW